MKTQTPGHAINGISMANLPIAGNFSNELEALQDVIANGNIASLSTEGRLKYVAAICNSLGLNPLTRPFEFIQLQGKLTLYARKDCTEQLRKIHGVSFESVEHRKMDDLYIVTVKAVDKTGRSDISTGVIPLGSVKGSDLANLIMKTETKAKRRATLSICGLGVLDESELDTVSEKNVTPPQINETQKTKLVQRLEQRKNSDKQERESIKVEEIIFATGEQVARLHELVLKLGKPTDYIERTLLKKFRHNDISEIPFDFAKEWIKLLEEKAALVLEFINEMDSEGANQD